MMLILENKIPPPIIAILLAAAMWWVSLIAPAVELNPFVRQIVIVLLIVLGAGFDVAAILAFRRVTTTVNPMKPETASSLVRSGIYHVSRNPMYVGLALFLTAWAVYLSSAWPYLGVLGFVLYMNQFQIAPEERALTKNFGGEYVKYQSKVRRWL
jgi:protein-S-isoprenylcysteine O-methyltransferase Ste14